jgi:hypothetical protein
MAFWFVIVAQPEKGRTNINEAANVAASRQSAANFDGNSNGGFLPKAATPKADLSRRNLMKAEGNSFPEFVLGWTNGGMDFVLTPALTFYSLPQERK